MVSDRLLALVSCPDCRVPFTRDQGALTCPECGRTLEPPSGGVLDARPAAAFAETTKYTDAALHADARHERVSPPLLGAGVRQRMLRRMLQPGTGDRIADLGCGSGRMLVWNAGTGAWLVGVDVSPFFAHEAVEQVDLVLGDLRRLPFPDGAFNKAWSLDVFEHLSEASLVEMLREANRILEPGGRLFVYTHVRRNSRLARGLRAINRLQAWLDRRGLVDVRQERLRKSDHVNPLADVPHLERVVDAAGFRIGRIRYYTPLIGGFVENILMRMAERWLARRQVARTAGAAGAAGDDVTDGVRAARLAAKARLDRGGPLRAALSLLTRLMMLDVALFGRVRSGPFFAVLVKQREAA
ncbi:MAG: methyltransferase domain-containing protein [Vicinamibacteraceae bacterium]|nr:methyltransferase domain-containing protein [Vicinamibacteraceae bacterium]